MREPTAASREARSWCWASLIAGAIVSAGALSGANVPLFLVQLLSIFGSLFFLCGGESLKSWSIPLVATASVLEALSSIVLLVIGIIFLADDSFSLYGLGVLIGIWSLILFVPAAAMAAIDYFTFTKIREALRAAKTESHEVSSPPLLP